MATELKKVLCKKCRLEFSAEALFCPGCGTAKNRDSDGDPLLGTTIGDRYQLVEQIGQGASGSIYLAEHVTLRRKVVVKVLHHELSRDDLAVERFRREATTVGDLDNDHIVEIHDFGRTGDGRLYLAMEYLEGQTLAAAIEEQGQIAVEQAVDVLSQLGEALIEAHAMGYVHRDLRPRNMFLALRRERANYLKLLDFGLAKLVEQEGEAASTSLGMTFGDPHYMSPEQARGAPVDRRADIYSIGCIAYEMLTGQPPFHGGKVFDVLTRQVEEAPRSISELAPQVPAWLERAVMRCLAKKPEDRFITVYRFVEALRQGTDSGVIMTDETARRRSTNPPASISRAMERLAGRSSDPESDVSAPATQPASAPATQPASAPATQPASKQASKPEAAVTQLGVIQASAVGRAVEEEATVPSPAPNMESPKEDAGGKKVGRVMAVDPNAESSTGLSAVWYADGDTLDGGGELSDKAQKKLDRARGKTPSQTGILSTSRDEDLYEEHPSSNRLKVILGVVGTVIAGIVLLAILSGGDEKKDKPEEATNEPVATAASSDATAAVVTPDATAMAVGPSVDAAPVAETLVADAGAVAVAPRNPKVRDPKPRDPKVRDPKPRDPKVRDPKPRDPKPRDPKVRDPKPRDPTGPDPFETGGASEADKVQSVALAKMGARDLQSGDILGAATNFNKARALNSRNVTAIAGLGEIALSQAAYSAAIGHLSKAARMRPRSARLWTLLGEAYLGNGANGKAAESFKKALKLHPDNGRARDGYNEATGN